MAAQQDVEQTASGAVFRTVDIAGAANWPDRVPEGDSWQTVAEEVSDYPSGRQASWGPITKWRPSTVRGSSPEATGSTS